MPSPKLTAAQLALVLPAALAAGTREAFEELLTPDVHWHGDPDAAQCHTRADAGQFYADLLATGLTLAVTDITVDDPHLTVHLQVTWPGLDPPGAPATGCNAGSTSPPAGRRERPPTNGSWTH